MNLQSVNSSPCILALGFFDGLHRGHIRLLQEVNRLAKEKNIPGKMLTLEPHPDIFFGRNLELLSDPEDRNYLADSLCNTDTVVLPFDFAVAKMSPEQFVDEVLIGRFSVTGVVVGEDYTFGNRAAGNAELLSLLCRNRNIAFSCVSPVLYEGSPISSTRIRKLLSAGEAEEAARMLGHPYLFSGVVEKGNQIGRTISFPSANLFPKKNVLLPAPGVYATRTRLPDGSVFPSVTNVGTRPTVDEDERVTVETHLIGYNGDIYGKFIRVFFDKRIRNIRHFSSLSELACQIRRDVDAVSLFNTETKPLDCILEDDR